MKNKNLAVSIVVPVYNERENIEKLIIRISEAMFKNKLSFEMIFIDDHSTDGTSQFFNRYAGSKNIVIEMKKGKRGKAYSLMQGFRLAKGDAVVMIDADLQYPPEAIPAMVKKLSGVDIVIAKRSSYNVSFIRKVMSNTFKIFFGGFLFNLHLDIQSGLKVFRQEVVRVISFEPLSGWAFDLEFLHRARQAGFSLAEHDITFSVRKLGESKVGNFSASIEMAYNALRTKLRKLTPVGLPAIKNHSMQGAGVRFKQQKYVTHTTLHHSLSAIETFATGQKVFLFGISIILIIGFLFQPFLTLGIFIAMLSTVYFFDVLFNLWVVLKSLYIPQELSATKEEMATLNPSQLPIYSILCPLYKEAHIIPQFLDAITKLDWPKNRLDVLLLLEEDDTESLQAVKKMSLPSSVRVVVVPQSQPKTKPKACNYGLSLAKGEYLVIYDAEDLPDVDQLKKAFLVFQKIDAHVICLQAKLNYFNPHQNLLTRFFTAEYSLWFDVTLTGLQSVNTSLPLGGTSNHFRTADLHKLQGWDPFNVTEDADLGIRLFKAGYRTAIIDSTTWEEANSKVLNWIRQRSRWIKGYMQTYLVHMRHMEINSMHDLIHSFYFQMTIGGKIAFILINPFLWLATIAYFTLYAYVGPAIEALYPSVIFYMAVVSLVFGNFMFVYYYMIGCAKRGQYELIKYVFLIPVYWLLISVAGFMALYQLFFKPHYWEKTVHGLHLLKPKKAVVQRQSVRFPTSPLVMPIRYVINLLF